MGRDYVSRPMAILVFRLALAVGRGLYLYPACTVVGLYTIRCYMNGIANYSHSLSRDFTDFGILSPR